MTEHSNETLCEDIRELARMLLADDVTGPIIRDAGVRRAFTPEEEELVFGRAKDAPMMAMFHEAHKDWCGDGWYWNPKVAIGLARQVVDGLIASIDDEHATDLIGRNLYPLISPNDERHSIHDKRVPFSLYHQTLCKFIESRDFDTLRQRWLTADADSDPRNRTYADFQASALEMQYRYGEIAYIDYASIANGFITRGEDYSKPKVVRDRLKLLNLFDERIVPLPNEGEFDRALFAS